MKHAYVVTERIPGIENMPNVRDHDASVYLKLQVDIENIPKIDREIGRWIDR